MQKSSGKIYKLGINITCTSLRNNSTTINSCKLFTRNYVTLILLNCKIVKF